MADHISAKKRARQNLVRHERNTTHYSKVKTVIRNFRKALSEGKNAELPALFMTAQATLAKAAAKGIIHRNNARRHTSRLALALKNLGSAKPAKATKTTAKTKPAKAAAQKKTAAPKAKKAPAKTKKK